MNSHLKRESFAFQLRKQQRECWRKQIRKQHMKESFHKNHFNINQEELQFIKSQCKNKNYTQKPVEKLLSILSEAHPLQIANDSNIRMLTNIVLMIEEAQFSSTWQREAHQKILSILKKLLLEEINAYHDGEWTKQFYDLVILKECFHFLVEGLCQCYSLVSLFQLLASVQNEQFLRFSCKQFLLMVERKQEQKAPIQILQILHSLIKFSDCQEWLGSNEKYHILSLVNVISESYDLSYSDKTKISLIVRNMLQTDLDGKVEYIINETRLIQYLFGYLEVKGELNKEEFNCMTTQLVAKMFASSQDVSDQVYLKCKNIIQILRNQLPMLPLPLNPLPNEKGLLHNNHRITKLTLFALSNIVATGSSYLNIYLNSDIFRCFLHLYELVQIHCREQIAICLRNMVAMSHSDSLFAILTSHFFIVLQMMLAETKNEQICMAGMRIIEMLLVKLGEYESEGKFSKTIDRRTFQIRLIENGSKTLIEGLLLSLNEDINNLSERILEMMRQETTM